MLKKRQLNLVKYRNRKLYDLDTSSYVTLTTVRDAVLDGAVIKVTQNRTGVDVTHEVLRETMYKFVAFDRTQLVQMIRGAS